MKRKLKKVWKVLAVVLAAAMVFAGLPETAVTYAAQEAEASSESALSTAAVSYDSSYIEETIESMEAVAYISSMTISIKDGTAPFDDPESGGDEPGNDSSDSDGDVRTFDDIIYEFDFTGQALDETEDSLDASGIVLEAELDCDFTEARFDTSTIISSWAADDWEIVYYDEDGNVVAIETPNLDYDSGSEESDESSTIVTDENGNTISLASMVSTKDTDGDGEADCYSSGVAKQVLTAIDEEATKTEGSSSWSVEGYSVYVLVQAASDGDIISPSFEVYLAGNEENLDGNGDKVACQTSFSGSETEVEVTAAPRYNIVVKQNDSLSNLGYYDFETGKEVDEDEATEDDIYGRMLSYGITIQLFNESNNEDILAEKGLKGIELPIGDITFDLELSTYVALDPDNEEAYTPILWDMTENISSTSGEWGRNLYWDASTSSYARNAAPYSSSAELGDDEYTVYSGGAWAVSSISYGDGTVSASASDPSHVSGDGSGTVYTLTVSDYMFDFYDWHSPTNTAGMSSSSSWLSADYVLSFSAGQIQVLQEFPESEDRTTDASIALTVEASNISATSVNPDGDEVTEESDSVSSSMGGTADNTVVTTVEIQVPGSLDKYNSFTTADASWMAGDDFLGSDFWNAPNYDCSALLGEDIALWGGLYSPEESDDWVHDFNILQLFDSEVLEITEGTTSEDFAVKLSSTATGTLDGDGDGTIEATYLYVADPLYPGGYDTNNDEIMDRMNTVQEEDLIYFESLDDLENAGYVCIGVLTEVRNCNFQGIAAVKIPVTVRETMLTSGEAVPTDGTTVCSTNVVRVWRNEDDDTSVRDASWANAAISVSNGNISSSAAQEIENYIPAVSGGYYDGTALSECSGYAEKTNLVYNYTKAEYDESGQLVAGTHDPGKWYGITLLTVGYQTHVEINVKNMTTYESSSSRGTVPFNYTEGQFTAKYTLSSIYASSSSDTGTEGSETIKGSTTTLTVTAEVPDGILIDTNYAITIEYYDKDGVYQEDEIELGESLTITFSDDDGEEYKITVTASLSEDCQTLTLVIENAPIDVDLPYFSFTAKLSDVNNNETLTATATISGEEDLRNHTSINGNLDTCSLIVSLLGSAALVKAVDSSAVDLGEEFTYTLRYSNTSDIDLEDVSLLDILPFEGDSLGTEITASEYTGNYEVSSIIIDFASAKETYGSLGDWALSLTSSKSVQSSSADDTYSIAEEILSGNSSISFTDVSSYCDNTDGKITWEKADSDSSSYTALLFEISRLAANESIDIYVTMTPVGADEDEESSGYGDIYYNRCYMASGSELSSDEEDSSMLVSNIVETRVAYTGIEITKTVVGTTEKSTQQEFTLNVTFTKNNRTYTNSLTYEVLDEDGKTVTDSDGNALGGTLKAEGTNEDGETCYTVTIKDGQTIRIIGLPDETYYEIEEGSLSGYRLTGSTNISGVTTYGEVVEVSLTNTYSASASATIKAHKNLAYSELDEGMFTFYLLDSDGNIIDTAENDEDGDITFSKLWFTEEDDGETYTYTIVEEANGLADYYEADDAVYTAQVSVSDDGDGTMTVTITYYDSEGNEITDDAGEGTVPTFENVYRASGELSLTAYKELDGRDLEEGEFTFKVEAGEGSVDADGNEIDEDDVPLPSETVTAEDGTETEKEALTASNDADGVVSFETIKFDETDIGCTYYYVISEVIPDEDSEDYDETVVYSTETVTYQVTVIDNGDGTLSFDAVCLEEDEDGSQTVVGAVIENDLEPGQLTIEKIVDDEYADDTEFTFTVVLTGITDEEASEGFPYTKYETSESEEEEEDEWIEITDELVIENEGSLSAGKYYLGDNVTLTKYNITFAGDSTLDLQGHTLTGTGSGSVVTVSSGVSLVLMDSTSEGTEIVSASDLPGTVYSDGTFYASTINNSDGTYTSYWQVTDGTTSIYYSYTSGAITGGKGTTSDSSTYGGGIYVSGTLMMQGGIVYGNSSTNGGGVYVEDGTLTINGGAVSGNTASNDGGGVYVTDGTLTIDGGAVSDNTAKSQGGGVRISSSTFTMKGGAISGNAASDGAGVRLINSTITMNGGVISGNTAKDCGNADDTNYCAGGVMMSNSYFTMNGGTISGNTASGDSGGVRLINSIFIMNGGTISNNTAGTYAGGVRLYQSSSFTMEGGTISNNTAGTYAGGVCVSNGSISVTSSDAVITDNTAGSYADDMYISSSATRSITAIAGTWYTDNSSSRYDNQTTHTKVTMTSLSSGTAYSLHSEVSGCTVTYDANSSYAVGTSFTQYVASTSTLADETVFYREGYYISSWNTRADGSGTSYSTSGSAKAIANSGNDITLYAQWTAETYTITASTDGNGTISYGSSSTSGKASSSFTASYGDNVTLTITPSSGYAVKDVEVDGISVGDVESYTFEGLSADHEVTAEFVYIGYTLALDANGGSGSMSNIEGPTTVPESNFYRYGYTFTGWNTAADGSGESYTPGDDLALTADTTFYAQWEENDEAAPTTTTWTVTLKAGESITYQIPAGVGYLVYEHTQAGWVLVESSGTSGQIEPLTESTASFTNEPTTETSTTIQLYAVKTLDGEAAEDGAFTFTLKDNSGTALQTKTNASGGTITFDTITYTEAGTYYYTISEISETEGTDGSISYDSTVYTVIVVVTANEEGYLEAVAVYTSEESDTDAEDNTFTSETPAFENTTNPGSLTIKKSVEGAELSSQEFTFTVTLTSGSSTETETVKLNKDNNWTYTLGDISDGTWYSVEETDIPSGYTLESMENAEGTITGGSTVTVSAVNSYSASGSFTAEALKTLEGRSLTAGEFSFTLSDSNGNVVSTASNDSEGKVAFSSVTLNAAGTYYYTISETTGDDTDVNYDSSSYAVQVIASDNGDGTLSCAVSYGSYNDEDGSFVEDTAGAVFENSLKTGKLKITKSVVDSSGSSYDDNGKSFKFTIRLYASTQEELTGEYSYTVTTVSTDDSADESSSSGTIRSGGTITLSSGQAAVITGLPAGAYYEVTEAEYDGYSSSSEGSSGNITAEETAVASFVNIYEAYGTWTLTAEKTLKGSEDMTRNEFSFQIVDEKGNVVSTGSNADAKNEDGAAEGTIYFNSISYTLADVGQTYTYTVKEVSGSDSSITYDDTEYTVKVAVSDEGDGTLSFETVILRDSEEVSEISFVNYQNYELPTSGGNGTFIIYLSGLLLIAGAITAAIVMRRRRGRRAD